MLALNLFRPADFFWAGVDRSGGAEACWPYQGPGARPWASFSGQSDRAYRIAWTLTHGPLLRARQRIAHTCASLACCNPRHLRLDVKGARARWRRTPEFMSWTDARTRCENPRCVAYPRYGGRGLRVCVRWHTYAHFLADMGPKPTARHTIDRIDNARGYVCGRPDCPDCGPLGLPLNCRWATRQEQNFNRDVNHRIVLDGVTVIAAEVCARHGVSTGLYYNRVRSGWDVVQAAITAPDALANRRARALAGRVA